MRKPAYVFIALFLSVMTARGFAQQSKQTSSLAKAVGCLASQEWALIDLREIGMRVGHRVSIRQNSGTIPDVTPDAPDRRTLLILNHTGNKGWMFFFRESEDGTITIYRNAYRVEHGKGGWTASEGNGGLATYKAIGSYAATLYRSPVSFVGLKPESSGCEVK